MWLFIQPTDTLFFRDGRPFDAGSDIWTGKIFPPYPSTLYGMTRTLFVHMANPSIDYKNFLDNLTDDFNDFLKDDGNLSIKGPFLGKKRKGSKEATLWIPAPSDLWKKLEEDQKPIYYFLQPHNSEKALDKCTDLDIPFLPLKFFTDTVIDSSALEKSDGVIGRFDLIRYLNGDHEEIRTINPEPFWQEEASTVIEKDCRLTAKEHKLAHPMYTRLQDSAYFEEKGFLIHISGFKNNLSEKIQNKLNNNIKPVRLGGEGKIGLVEVVSVTELSYDTITEKISSSGKFRIILTSPAYFLKNGFYPDFLNQSNNNLPEGKWEIEGERKKVTLVSMTTGERPARIGGWDIVARSPKEMIKAVPAGAVYFFKINDFEEENNMEWLKNLFSSSLPGAINTGDEKYIKQGFGTFLIGGWDYVS